jgi:hypothetical protein
MVGQRTWIRARFNGTSVRARVWKAGDTEPSAWALDTTEATITGSGWVGLTGFDNTGQPKYCDYFSCDMAGGTAPGIGDTPGTGQYSTDFSTQSLGTPADWTARWTTTASTWSIVDTVPNVMPEEIRSAHLTTKVYTITRDNAYEGGHYLAATYGTQTAQQFHTFWDSPVFQNGNVYATIQSPDTQTATNTTGGFWRACVAARVSGTSGSMSGYVFGQIHHPVTNQTRRWGFTKFVNAGVTTVPSKLWLSNADEWSANTIYEIRLEVFGTTVRGRYWEQGDYEPEAWAFEITDTSLTSGRAGMFGQYSVSTTPTTAEYFLFDAFGFETYEIIDADLSASFLQLSGELTGETEPANTGNLQASFLPLSAELQGQIGALILADVNAAFLPLSGELTGVRVSAFEYPGALAFGTEPEDLLEVPVLTYTEAGRTAPQPRRRFSGRVSTDQMTVGSDTDDRRPRAWDIQTGYMAYTDAADVLHQLTAGGYFYASGYIVGAPRFVSASEITYQEGDMPDLVQLSFVLRTR